MKKEYKYASIFFAIIAVGIISISYYYEEVDLKRTTIDDSVINDKTFLRKSPQLQGISGYINTSQQEMDKQLEGKVVLYDFWTYSCINCIRTIPHLTAWDEKYSDEGLVILGIHSPEFEFEKKYENVVFATEKFGIKYPVIQDNDKEIWNDFQNRYWPRKYIADHEGYIRFDHIGEGAYKETEEVIQLLLKERANAVGSTIQEKELVNLDEFEHATFRTPELYFGYKFAEGRNQLGSQEGFSKNNIVNYQLPDQVNIVADGNAILKIEYDGGIIPIDSRGYDINSNGEVIISEPRLYNLIELDQEGPHEIIIKVAEPNFEIFTFTFG